MPLEQEQLSEPCMPEELFIQSGMYFEATGLSIKNNVLLGAATDR